MPLLKGLKIGEICTELIETQEFRLDNIKHPRCRTTLRTVAREKWHLPDDAQTEEVDGQDAYILHKLLPIPKSLRHCLQTVDTQGFKIRHILSFNIQLHNPDAHISEVIFITQFSQDAELINDSYMPRFPCSCSFLPTYLLTIITIWFIRTYKYKLPTR